MCGISKEVVWHDCPVCGKHFMPNQRDAIRGMGKFCSKDCYHKYQRSQSSIVPQERICPTCGKKFISKPSSVNQRHTTFCSPLCRNKYRVGDRNGNFKDKLKEYKCDNCGKIYKRRACELKRNKKHFCSRICQNIYQAHHQPKISSIEKKVEKELERRHINFKPQEPLLNATIADFYLPEHNIVVYCDGDYWHNLPSYKKRDTKINILLQANGYTVIRLWEHDINNDVVSCVDRIELLISGGKKDGQV